jgi:hypothetical protein
MECVLCKTILGNNEKNIAIKFNDENYCRGCYEVSNLFDINNNIMNDVKIPNIKEKPNGVNKVKSKFICPRCKIPMEKNCLKCRLKNPLWR